MNDGRRKQIAELLTKIEEAMAEAQVIIEAEQESFDGMPESLQSGANGEKSQEAISNLEQAASDLESARDALETAKE